MPDFNGRMSAETIAAKIPGGVQGRKQQEGSRVIRDLLSELLANSGRTPRTAMFGGLEVINQLGEAEDEACTAPPTVRRCHVRHCEIAVTPAHGNTPSTRASPRS